MRVGWNPPIIAKNGDFCATNLTKKLLVNTQPHNLYLQVHRQSVIDIGRRTQFLKRMVQFSDWSGLEIRLVYYPPYHSKYNLIERCWSALEKKWNGVLLNCLEVVLQCALRMTWKGQHPIVKRLEGRVSRRHSCCRQGDEGVRSSIGTIGDPAEVRHNHQAENRRAAGKVSPAARHIRRRSRVT